MQNNENQGKLFEFEAESDEGFVLPKNTKYNNQPPTRKLVLMFLRTRAI